MYRYFGDDCTLDEVLDSVGVLKASDEAEFKEITNLANDDEFGRLHAAI